MIAENTPGSSILMFIAFNTIFVLLGSATFSRMGYLKLFIEEIAGLWPEHSMGWVNHAYKKAGLKKRHDGENGEGEDDDDDYLPPIPKKDAGEADEDNKNEENEAEDEAKKYFYF